MRTPLADSRRHLLYVLFCLFEILLIASIIVLVISDPRARLLVTTAAAVTYWFAFVGLFAVCFILRHAAPRLAVVGWLSLFAAFWSGALMPTVP